MSHRKIKDVPDREVRDPYYSLYLKHQGSEKFQYLPKEDQRGKKYDFYDRIPHMWKGIAKPLIVTAIVTLAFVILSIGMIDWKGPSRLSSHYDPRIADEAKILEDEGSLMDVLNEYKNVTGISAAIYTVYDDVWKDNKGQLSLYAKSLYGQNFSGAEGIVIVMSVPREDIDLAEQGKIRIPRYNWGSAQGDSAGTIINFPTYLGFTMHLKKDIDAGQKPDKALANAIRFLIEDGNRRFNPTPSQVFLNAVLKVLPLIITLSLGGIVSIVILIRHKKRSKALKKAAALEASGQKE